MNKTLLLALILGVLVSCNSNNSNSEVPDAIDITDAIFTELSTDCTNYAEDYASMVRDIQRNSVFEGAVTIEATSDHCQISVNGIPNHDFNDQSANFATNVSTRNRAFTIAQHPALAENVTALSQNYYDAVMLNGVVVDMLSAGCYRPNSAMADADGNVPIGCTPNDPWLVDPLGSESKFGADANNAHTQPDGTYHYHGNPKAMFDDNPGINGSPVIGFAADGFPIYGSYFLDPSSNQVRKAISGYTLKAGLRPGPDDTNPGGSYNGLYVDDYEFTDAGDLDECNGMSVNGSYAYYVTDSYPWMLACHSGSVHASFGKGGAFKATTDTWHHAH